MCANLAHPTDDDEIYTPNHNALSGQTVSSMYKLKDIDNNGKIHTQVLKMLILPSCYKFYLRHTRYQSYGKQN